MSIKAVYPGSFDPITLGHLDIIKRLQKIFGEVIILLAQHPGKKYLFSLEERKKLIAESVGHIKGVKVDVHDGLTVDFMKKAGAQVIVRGLRAVTDYEYELVMANMNKRLAPDIETLIVFASPEYYYVSSSTIKEVARYGGKIDQLVPANVLAALHGKFAEP